jgi:hypothetical protein
LNDLFCNYWCRTIFPHLLRCPRRNLLFWSHSIDCPCTWTVNPGENLMNYSWKMHEYCSWISIKSTWTIHERAWTLNCTVHESNSSWTTNSWTFCSWISSWTNVHE